MISPNNIYEFLDETSRELTLAIAEYNSLGMGVAILSVSVLVKIFLTPFNLLAQVQGIKMRLIAPEMKLFQNQMSTAQKAGNYKEMNESRDKLSRLQERYGVSSATSAVAILQMPFLITWFLSVRYMSMSPELFPGMLDGGFGWMINLTEHDPYFLTPFISACFSSLNISYSPAATQTVGASPIAKYMKFMKYMPFMGFPILMYFPSGLCLYWCTVSSLHLLTTLLMRTSPVKKMLGVDGFLPGTILHKQNFSTDVPNVKAVFADVKKSKKTVVEKNSDI